MSYPFDRAFYRLRYPPDAAPKYREEGRVHRVVDIGEGGFRYAPSNPEALEAGETTSGVIEFRDGRTLEVAGTIVRIQGGEVAVHCAERPIPLAVVLTEQREVRKRYPFGVKP
jgi:hypothetical protein